MRGGARIHVLSVIRMRKSHRGEGRAKFGWRHGWAVLEWAGGVALRGP